MNRKKTKLFDNKKTLAVYIICNALAALVIIGSVIVALTRQGEIAKTIERIGLCVLAILFYNLPLFLRYRHKLRIPTFLQITVMVFAIAHFILGEIFRVYDYSLLFDKILHTTSGVIFGIVGFSLINGLNETDKGVFKLSPIFVAIFSFCFSLAIGYLWELIEFAVDTVFKTNMQRWQDSFFAASVNGEDAVVSRYGQGSGLIDTMGDMIVNMIGAFIISLTGYIRLKKNKTEKMEGLLIRSIKEASEKAEDGTETGQAAKTDEKTD